MRVLYVAPRYHTNQIPVVKGWLEAGHQVMFVSQFQSTPEDYTVLKPVILGYQRLSDWLIHTGSRIILGRKYTKEREYAWKIKAGLPPVRNMKRILKAFSPELVIVRERSLYNVPFAHYCRKRKIPCILYNQSPVWDRADRDKGLGHRLLIGMLPKYRMTPVLGKEGSDTVRMKDSFYIPFVIVPRLAPSDKPAVGNPLQLLCVARYEKRKNLFMLVEAVKELLSSYDIHLTIIGEATDASQRAYRSRLKEKIQEYGIAEHISLEQNYTMEEMYRAYGEADLFVLPSTRERASISQLEAMSCSVPVLCSDTNGTACYVSQESNGCCFRDNDKADLLAKLEWMISDRKRLRRMGEQAYQDVVERYQFAGYYQGIMEIAERERREKRT